VDSIHPENQAAFIDAETRDTDVISNSIEKYGITGIVHLAALKSVAQSMAEPDLYIEVNYEATKTLLGAAQSHGIKQFIFSSSAAVYGSPETGIIKESDETNPISPYGESKLLAEKALNDFLDTYSNKGTSLRFFNVVGTAYRELIDNSRENLVPIVINALQQNQAPVIFGFDYPTPDDTCIRDYVDVRDIARAHLKVAESQISLPRTLSIGTGRGRSIREIIDPVLNEANCIVKVEESNRRAGDPAILIGEVTRAKEVLNFTARHSLEESIDSLFANSDGDASGQST
jgi:UDP-glucose 4-epimerase